MFGYVEPGTDVRGVVAGRESIETDFGLGPRVGGSTNTDAAVSHASPTLTGIYFVLLLFASTVVLQEQVSPLRWGGTLLIVLGILLISKEQVPTP